MGHEILTKGDIQFLKGCVSVNRWVLNERLENTTPSPIVKKVTIEHIKKCDDMLFKLENLSEFPEL